MHSFKKQALWQEDQKHFFLNRKRRIFSTRIYRLLLIFCLMTILVYSIGYFFLQSTRSRSLEAAISSEKKKIPDIMNRQQVRDLIKDFNFMNRINPVLKVGTGAEQLTIVTGLDPDLQKYTTYMLDQLKTMTRGKPRRIVMIAMNPNDGQVLAMSGFDFVSSMNNPALISNYPAASIFKIITAAAAMEQKGYSPYTYMYFNGNKYTLYKKQLNQPKNRYSVTISLKKAFAQSVNPVFGKLGKILGASILEKTAYAFGFNQVPISDLIFESGHFDIGTGEYRLAELGSGFNTDTMISPLFGAMIATVVMNEGKILVPVMVDRIKNSRGKVIYQYKKEVYRNVISPATANALASLMEGTVSMGTASKTFRNVSRDNILSKLHIGGKTGSISNRDHTIKYDWFVGFGKEKQSNRAIVVSIVVGHGKYIGTKASVYGKMMLKEYFKKK